MQPETKFKIRVQKFLKASGIPLWSFKSQEVAVRGIPDIVGCNSAGQFFCMELKRDEVCKPDPLQEYNLEKIRKLGGIALVLNPFMNWQKLIEESGIFPGE